jgi:hypothetical protein
MIYISFGVPKSASTFTYVVTEQVLKLAGYEPVRLSETVKGGRSRLNYIDPISWGAVERVIAEIGEKSAVIKTHGAPDKRLLEVIERGEIFASVVIRDPREIALSLLDHANRSRRLGDSDFAELETITDTFKVLDDQFTRLEKWLQCSKVLLLTYDVISFDTELAVRRIIDQIGATLAPTEVLSALPDKGEIEQFNKGIKKRYELEMSVETQQLFRDRYADVYHRFPRLEPVEIPRECGQSAAPKPSGARHVVGKAVAPARKVVGFKAEVKVGGSRQSAIGVEDLGAGSGPSKSGFLAGGIITGDHLGVRSWPRYSHGVQKCSGLFAGSKGPTIAPFTSAQASLVSALSSRIDGILIARFRSDPGSRPTIYLKDRRLLTVPRIAESVEYLDGLITNYLLRLENSHLNVERATGEDERYCVLQANDVTERIAGTIGYCGIDYDIALIPDIHFWSQTGYIRRRQAFRRAWVPWQEREQRAFWRGSTTGTRNLTIDSFRTLPRFKLCSMAAHSPVLQDRLDAKLTSIVQAADPVADESIGLLARSLGVVAPVVGEAEFLRYRYQVDIDGNSNSWSFLPKLLMGSCVLKVTSDWRQWYYDRVRPWEHYVPVKNDLSDLEERLVWCLENDEAAHEIGVEGMRLANGIIFSTEMTRAAARVLEVSRIELEDYLKR